MIGDGDQNIYGWRGAVFDDLMVRVREDTATDGGYVHKFLTLNYRSTGAVVDFCNAMIACNSSAGRELQRQPLRSAARERHGESGCRVQARPARSCGARGVGARCSLLSSGRPAQVCGFKDETFEMAHVVKTARQLSRVRGSDGQLESAAPWRSAALSRLPHPRKLCVILAQACSPSAAVAVLVRAHKQADMLCEQHEMFAQQPGAFSFRLARTDLPPHLASPLVNFVDAQPWRRAE